jgi:AhpD family alkylhydroperoxidase
MSNRIDLHKEAPKGFQVMLSFNAYLTGSELNRSHRELIKIRASQINGCAYCLDMHTKDARKLGETEQRIYALSAWRDTPFFTAEERAILALTEEITLITQGVSDVTYQNAVQVLGESYTALVMLAAIEINAWNRIGIATHMSPSLG